MGVAIVALWENVLAGLVRMVCGNDLDGVHLARGRRFGRARAHFVRSTKDDVSWNSGMDS